MNYSWTASLFTWRRPRSWWNCLKLSGPIDLQTWSTKQWKCPWQPTARNPVGHSPCWEWDSCRWWMVVKWLYSIAWGQTTHHPALHRIKIVQTWRWRDPGLGTARVGCWELAIQNSFWKFDVFSSFLCSCRELLKGEIHLKMNDSTEMTQLHWAPNCETCILFSGFRFSGFLVFWFSG